MDCPVCGAEVGAAADLWPERGEPFEA